MSIKQKKQRGIGWKSAGKRRKSNRFKGDALCPYKKPKFECGLVECLKREEEVWKMKAKNKRKREMEKSAGKRRKSNRFKGDALCPYKKPKFERGLVKSLKKEEEKDNFSSTCRSTISWAIASKGKRLTGALTLSRFSACRMPVHQYFQTFFSLTPCHSFAHKC
jgi:hypothetical protein